MTALEDQKPDEKTKGVYRLITLPAFYGGFQQLLGAQNARVRLVKEWIRSDAASHILDLGCGPGQLQSEMDFSSYTGVDLNPRHIAQAQARFGSDKVCFRAGPAQEVVPGLEGPFDRVICSGFMHHLNDRDVADLVGLLTPKLAPGGFIASLEPVILPRQRWAARAIKRIDSGQHIRTHAAWQELLEPWMLEHRITHDLLRIPYDHIWLKLGQR